MDTIRNRIRELRYVRASELVADPRNWRRHPKAQRDAMAGMLREIGYADALLARETPDGLVLIDGHLRREMTPDQEVPVLVLDVDEHEASVVLAALDPLAGMAEADPDALDALLRQVSVTDAALREMLFGVGLSAGAPPDDPVDEWQDMPEFHQENRQSVRDIIVHFADEADVADFAAAVGQTITEKMKYIWFPFVPDEKTTKLRYAAE